MIQFTWLPVDAVAPDPPHLPLPGGEERWGGYEDPCQINGSRTPVDHTYLWWNGGRSAAWEKLTPFMLGVEAELFWSDAMSVAMIFSFPGYSCPDGSPIGQPIPQWGTRTIFGSRHDGFGAFAFLPTDMGEHIGGIVRSSPLAPAGLGGECLFTNIYVAMSSTTGGVAVVTPIVDGERLEHLQRNIGIVAEPEAPDYRRWEIGLHVDQGDFSAQGVRGTWIQVEVNVLDMTGCGNVEIHAVEVEWEAVTESHPGRTYAEEPQNDYVHEYIHPLVMGSRGGGLGVFNGTATDDMGSAFTGRASTEHLAPAGSGGECIFTNVYACFRRSNRNPVSVRITPYVDGVPHLPVSVTLPAVQQRVTDVWELGLHQDAGFSAQAVRGSWIQLDVEILTAVTAGLFQVEALEIEFEPVTEGYPGKPTGPGRDFREYTHDLPWPLLVGRAEGGLAVWDGSGASDAGAPVLGRAQTAPVAPAGIGGECIFTNLYPTFRRSNRNPVTVTLTPIVDNVERSPLSITLPGVDRRVTETYEIGLHVPLAHGGTEFAAQALRGCWWALRVDVSTGVPIGHFQLEGVELEVELVTESEDPA